MTIPNSPFPGFDASKQGHAEMAYLAGYFGAALEAAIFALESGRPADALQELQRAKELKDYADRTRG